MALVTLTQAKAHLRIDGTVEDADVTLKLAQAEDIVTDYLGDAADPTWTDATVPPRVQAAVLFTLGDLYSDRGDEERRAAPLSAAVQRILERLRDPAVG